MNKILVGTDIPTVLLYKEDSNHKMPTRYLEESIYSAAMESFVIVCTDAVIINRQQKKIYLTRRCVKPMKGLWIIGGRSFAGETPLKSVQRCFKRETSLNISQERFQFICLNRYLWKDRKQKPQNVGSDNLAYTFAVELTSKEIEVVSRNLDPDEHEAETGFLEVDSDSLSSLIERNEVHPMIVDLYKRIFPDTLP